MTKNKLTTILAAHVEWLQNNDKGKRADLSRADLSRANLTRANLTRASLDYSSGIPFHCGGANFTCDIKLIRPEALKSHRAKDLKLEGGGE